MFKCPKCNKEISDQGEEKKNIPEEDDKAYKYLLDMKDSDSEAVIKQLARGEIDTSDIGAMAKLEKSKSQLPKIFTDNSSDILRILRICPNCSAILRPFFNNITFLSFLCVYSLFSFFFFTHRGNSTGMRLGFEIFIKFFIFLGSPLIFFLAIPAFWEHKVVDDIDKESADLRMRVRQINLFVGWPTVLNSILYVIIRFYGRYVWPFKVYILLRISNFIIFLALICLGFYLLYVRKPKN